MNDAMARRPRLAVVVQRYGADVAGGAELHARWLAEHLTALADVHVLTTCAQEYTTWANYYPSGTTVINGVTVHRFRVDRRRDWARSDALSRTVALTEPDVDTQLAWMRAQGPLSADLLRAIRAHAPQTTAFIFFTYLYATTFLGLQLAAPKSILVPTAHDEPFLYLPIMRPTFHRPYAVAYNTAFERELVNRVTGNAGVPREAVVGIGINEPGEVSADRFRRTTGIDGDFILYVGRIAPAKNLPELFDQYVRYYERAPRPLKLVLGGRGHLPIPDHPGIIPLGFLSEQQKFDAIDAATAVVMPSKYESLSMILLESWLRRTPVIVNGACDVLRRQVQRSGGGLYYTSTAELFHVLDWMQREPDGRARLGRQGEAFTRRTYAWPVILDKYAALLAPLAAAEA